MPVHAWLACTGLCLCKHAGLLKLYLKHVPQLRALRLQRLAGSCGVRVGDVAGGNKPDIINIYSGFSINYFILIDIY